MLSDGHCSWAVTTGGGSSVTTISSVAAITTVATVAVAAVAVATVSIATVSIATVTIATVAGTTTGSSAWAKGSLGCLGRDRQSDRDGLSATALGIIDGCGGSGCNGNVGGGGLQAATLSLVVGDGGSDWRVGGGTRVSGGRADDDHVSGHNGGGLSNGRGGERARVNGAAALGTNRG